ncbi:hypothetical protein IVB43_23900 [Bradyrhizobium sp. 48]|uniref:hypothetical protein n=1 Tax=Bradyrhizobium sp. 48 TaxID=2782676 RepID=UPI001FF9C9CC|nr:hypothetical protein [Bradyrhizobium sp. 48]MCK1445433.1 hypothetical protein [Bradyrhizobium sp. 48]
MIKPIRSVILAFILMAGLTPAFAQAPPPVPALPDAERRQTYAISGTTCACNVNFALYGDGSDFQSWVEVYLNGVRVNFNDATFGWTITSPSGPIGSIARPITNAVLTFNSAQTGTVQIVGARRPRRAAQFSENSGVSARDMNQVLTDIVATQRETWDKTNDVTGRAIVSQPGNTLGMLPLPSTCAGTFLGFDSTGLNPICIAGGGSGGAAVTLPVTSGHLPVFDGTTGLIKDSGVGLGTAFYDPGSLNNCALSATVSANALTVAIKTQAGADPTPAAACTISFRSATAGSGAYSSVAVTAATSFSTATSGSTFGVGNNVPFRLWVTAWNNAGSVSLGLSRQSDTTGWYPIEESELNSSTACSSCGTATSTGVFYTTAAQSSVPIRILGYLEWGSGLVSAGVWATAPTKTVLSGPGMRKPGDAVQTKTASSTSNATSTSLTPANTGLSVSISPVSAVNLVQVYSTATIAQSTNNVVTHVRLARGGTFVGTSKKLLSQAGNALFAPTSLSTFDLPGTTSSTNYALQYWNGSAGTAVLNGTDGDGSEITATEIQG